MTIKSKKNYSIVQYEIDLKYLVNYYVCSAFTSAAGLIKILLTWLSFSTFATICCCQTNYETF